jgi:ferredoxin
MTRLSVTVSNGKCQAHGACLKTAAYVFRQNAEGKAEVLDAGAASDEIILAAARGCPYRAITVVATETGLQIFPRVRS